MLEYLGIKNIDELFDDLPSEVRAELNLPEPKSDMEVERERGYYQYGID